MSTVFKPQPRVQRLRANHSSCLHLVASHTVAIKMAMLQFDTRGVWTFVDEAYLYGRMPKRPCLATAYSHSLYNEDVHVNVRLTQLFQRGIVRVVVPCLGQLKRRKLQENDGEGRLAFQSQKARRGVAPDQRVAAVFCDQGGRLREIFLCPFRSPKR